MIRFLAAVIACTCLTGAAAHNAPGQQAAQPGRIDSFHVDPGNLATVGENTYLILRPGYQLTLEGSEDGKPVRLVVTVLNQTQTIGGVDTRVVEERETQAGALVEVSRNFLAIEKTTKDVFYFGEDVDIYKGGKIVAHEGAWRHGSEDARFGLMMPGAVRIGLRYQQELAPEVAMDRAEIVSLTDRLQTPAGVFERCLKTEETTPLETGREYKVYAPGVGLVKDGPLVLVRITRAEYDMPRTP
jgi:hypothetical protein